MIELEKIAHEAASTYCRCSKCNGINRDTGLNCVKDDCRNLTCNQYFIGYETALIALERMNDVLGNPVEKVQHKDCLELKTYRHWINEENFKK